MYQAQKYTEAELQQYGLTLGLARDIKRFMINHAEVADSSTVLAEMAADRFDNHEWLDDNEHPIWEWALQYFGETE